MKKCEVTILAPAFNEEKNLKFFIEHILDNINKNWRLLIINDGSEDDTEKILANYKSKYLNFSYISHPKNLGIGKAFQTGFNNIDSDYVITIDADMSHEINMVNQLYQNKDAADIVLASIFEKNSQLSEASKIRLFISKIGNLILKKILGFEVNEVAGGPRIYNSKFIKDINIKSNGFESQIEILLITKKKGATFSEIPIILSKRKFGESKMNYFKMGFGILKIILKVK